MGAADEASAGGGEEGGAVSTDATMAKEDKIGSSQEEVLNFLRLTVDFEKEKHLFFHLNLHLTTQYPRKLLTLVLYFSRLHCP